MTEPVASTPRSPGEADELLGPSSTEATEATEAVAPTFRQALMEKLDEHRSTARAMTDQGKPPPILDLMGGKLGMAEAVLPVVVFSSVYGIIHDLRTSIMAALVPTVAIASWRILRREQLTTALSGVFAVGIGAFIASRTGDASDFFWPSVLKNAAYALGYGVSAVVGWPLIGVLLGYLLGEGTAWRRNPARRRAYVIASWLWCAMFGLRAAVQTPLLLADQTVALGAVNVALGLPLFFLTIWATWIVVRRVPIVRPDDEAAAGPTGDPAGEAAKDPAVSSGADRG